jgi:hypothetical protein
MDTGLRTGLVWTGMIVARIGNFLPNEILSIVVLLIGTIITVWGCYLWTQLKNRHWAFMFWGILAPIGLLGISLLKDKSNVYRG